MPVCCRCNGSGRCRGCSCAKAGRQCTSCLPLRKGQCCNATVSTRDTNIIIEEDNQTIQTGPIEESDSTLTSLIDAHQYIQEVTPILEDITITNGSNIPQLPTVNVVSCSTTMWGNLTGQEFSEAINSAYSQIVHWRPNVFMVPSGNRGKQFIGNLAKLFDAYAQESSYEAFAIKAAMTMPALLLQKPHSKSKTKEHITCLSRRLTLWENGDIAQLLKEGNLIQGHLHSPIGARKKNDDDRLARTFSKLMMEGRVRAAIRLLANNAHAGLLSLNEKISNDPSGKSVRDILEEKHPNAAPAHPEAILTDSQEDSFYPVLFESITDDLIRKCSLLTEGAAGPSGVDAMCWRRYCTAFGQKSNDLCSALAAIYCQTNLFHLC